MARMILLGVGTGVPDASRENTHMVWDGPGGPLLIDAGGSTYQRLLRAGLDPQALRGILLTHSHADHINGLPVLLFSLYLAGRREPLPIYGLEPTLKRAQAILSVFDLDGFDSIAEWQTVAAGDTLPLDDAGWILRTALTEHSRPCLALRFEDTKSGAAVAYSCDTRPCPAVSALVQGARVLIHEATTPGQSPVHTSPSEAGAVAGAAGADRLVLVHYSPRWTMPEIEALAEVRAGGFEGQAEIGQEFQVVSVA